MMPMLQFFFSISGNYAIAIILLTLAIKVIFYPLTVKQFKSMNAMKDIEPQRKMLQEKYKTDPARMQQETMKLFKENKVNPFNGCLPLVVQLPFFISLFLTLQSKALNDILQVAGNAGEFLWIHNLTKADPFLILPLLVGISTYLSQKTMPNAGLDPNNPQTKILMFMPFLMFFISMKLAAGVLIYWAVSQFVATAQQLLISRPEKK